MILTESKIVKLKTAVSCLLCAFQVVSNLDTKPKAGKTFTVLGFLMQLEAELERRPYDQAEIIRILEAINAELAFLDKPKPLRIAGDYGPKKEIDFNHLKDLNK